MLEDLIQKIRQGDVQSFEDFYILTYDTLYSYAWILTGAQKEKAQEILIRTYCRVYELRGEMPGEVRVYGWLYQQMDQIAAPRLEMTMEQLQQIKAEGENHETVVELTEETAASILLSIEELLGFMDEREETFDKKKKIMSVLTFGIACVCLAFAVFAMCSGIEEVRKQLKILRQPLIATLPSDDSSNEEEVKDNRIKVSNKIYYLSDIGQVLYSLPLEESDWLDKTSYNSEIQETEKWVYYLPSPERDDSKLANVSSRLVHTLYRMKKQDQSMEIVAEEVQDYMIHEGGIYVMQYNRLHMLDEADDYEVLEDDIFAEVKEDGIYLYHILGNSLSLSASGTIQIEDRVYKMKGNLIESVTKADYREGDISWYLDTENGNQKPELYQTSGGGSSVFDTLGIRIDSFCRAGDWIYYSVYMRNGGSGSHYSEVYRKPISGGDREMVREEFSGRIKNMYYNQDDRIIYTEYLPQSWENGRGVIGVITPEGSFSTLNDPAIRAEEETTGSDNLSFVMVQGQDVLCYWNNRYWTAGTEGAILWSKPLTLSGSSRTPVPTVIHQTPQ